MGKLEQIVIGGLTAFLLIFVTVKEFYILQNNRENSENIKYIPIE